MRPTTLELIGVTKKFDDLAAVSDLSLKIAPGEIYGLIGPNGSGKTTTIKMIAGLYRPTRGAIKIAGLDAAEAPTRAKRHLGYIPDDPAAYDRLTGREFMSFVGKLYGMKRPDRTARIDALLGKYGLEHLADGLLGSYSRGTRQKISILSALLHEPSLLLIDEPMIGLDPLSARVTKELFREFAGRGGAILLSTHTLPIAEELCGRIGILKKGKLAEEGTMAELGVRAGLTHGTLEDYYLALTA
jgi:ABC-2 type transport system ATP-binding protein